MKYNNEMGLAGKGCQLLFFILEDWKKEETPYCIFLEVL